MIHLFPKIKNRMLLISAIYIGLVAVYIALNPTSSPLAILAISIAGLAVVMFSQYLNAINAHSRLLAKLYDQLNVDSFLREYEPLLKVPVKNPNIRLSVRLHTSNAYCAQGRFDEAMQLLSSSPLQSTGKTEDDLLSRFAIVSNLCYCAEQKNDLAEAQRYLDDLLSLKAQLEALQTGKPEKKRMVFNTELNEQCFKFLKTGNADIEVLKNLVRNNTQQLHRITISLWIARADLAVNNRREAESILNQIVKLAPDLYPGKAAAELLASLPVKGEAKA